MNFSQTLNKIIARENLTQAEMTGVFDELFAGALTASQIGGFLTALATKGITFEELAGAATAMRAKAAKINVTKRPLVDVVGTGGDGMHTFNISTISALVTAGAGVTVAKHGNRSASSKCGSADVLEELGVDLNARPEVVEQCINEVGVGFMFARTFHGAMKYAAPVRSELGVRTIFNLLGPLTNPAGAGCHVMGVYSAGLTELFANALKLMGAERSMVVHGLDGLDEITVCAETRVSELKNGKIETYNLDPKKFFGELAKPEDLTGGDAKQNAAVARAILAGEKGPRRNIVLLNTAAALVTAGVAGDMQTGIELAEKSIDSGSAGEKLERMVEFIREAS